MIIAPFATQQTDVFIPALGALAGAALFAVLPVVLAPALRRRRSGRALSVLTVVVAVALLVVTAAQAGAGFRAISDQRGRVQVQVAEQYGLHLDDGQVGTLIDGGGLELRSDGYGKKGVRFMLLPNTTDDYRLVYGKGATATPLPTK